MEHIPMRREVWYAELPLRDGSFIQGGNRPVVIISNNACNTMNSIVTVVPLTRKLKKLSLPTHVVIDSPDGGKSMALVEQMMTIDKSLLADRLGECSREDMANIEESIRNQLGLDF